MGRRVRLLVALCAAATVACGAAARIDHQVASRTYVPWAPLKASAANPPEAPETNPVPPYPIPSGTPSCTASQLEAMIGYANPYPGGNVNLPIIFRDRASRDCVVEGYPDLTVLDATGRVLASVKGAAAQAAAIPSGPVVPIVARAGTPALKFVDGQVPSSAGQLFIDVAWYDCRRPQASTLAVDLPNGGGRLSVAFPERGGYYMLCDTSPSYRALLRGPFGPTGIQWPPDLHRYISNSISIASPAPVKTGASLVFFVTVANNDTIDYVLDPCPNYNVFLGPKTVIWEYSLNCAPVGRIRAGSQETFEMRLAVPKGVAAGEYVLQWSLIDFRITSITATSHVEVVA